MSTASEPGTPGVNPVSTASQPAASSAILESNSRVAPVSTGPARPVLDIRGLSINYRTEVGMTCVPCATSTWR